MFAFSMTQSAGISRGSVALSDDLYTRLTSTMKWAAAHPEAMEACEFFPETKVKEGIWFPDDWPEVEGERVPQLYAHKAWQTESEYGWADLTIRLDGGFEVTPELPEWNTWCGFELWEIDDRPCVWTYLYDSGETRIILLASSEKVWPNPVEVMLEELVEAIEAMQAREPALSL